MATDRAALERILEKIREARNFDFRQYKRATLLRRIERRMLDRRCGSLGEYAELLDASPDEYDALLSSMLIKVTSFFRDPEVWEVLRKKVLPAIAAAKGRGQEIRAWSVGCATGEEAYSVAMVASEALGSAAASATLKVFATDVDETALAVARRGIYPKAALADLPPERRERFFAPTPEGYSVRGDLRRMVVFGVNNIVRDAPISRLDLLVCRNVFIYLDAQLQRRVLARFHYALRPNGFLLLGKSELVPLAAKLFEPADASRRVYRRGTARPEDLGEPSLAAPVEEGEPGEALRAGQQQAELDAAGQLNRDVVNAWPSPVIATTLDGNVTLWNTAAARVWRRLEGDVRGKRITALGLSGLPGDLLIEKTAAVRDGKLERGASDTRPDRDGGAAFSVEVTPLRGADGAVSGLLYVGQDVTSLRALEIEVGRLREQRDKAVEDLQTTAEEMQSSSEELETTNEELQSANEELQTTNEELQSMNEELETTNEELQSTNAELDATNRELAHRTDELNLSSFRQRVIIRSIASAVVVVDPGGRVALWNLGSERLFGLTELEAVGQVLWTLRIPILGRAIVKQIRKHVQSRLALRVEDIPYERPAGAAGHAALIVVPLVESERASGAVLLLDDTTRAVDLAEQRLREELEAHGGPRRPKARKDSAAARRRGGPRRPRRVQ